jgi:hypothetical protein
LYYFHIANFPPLGDYILLLVTPSTAQPQSLFNSVLAQGMGRNIRPYVGQTNDFFFLF